mmetsp:Transcript_35333/g.89454  ORF Transcript_35333/g.89454 Transcript_35333/m.89454 type:complete len:287 (-) Transcript_35333:352-1212(-)|eukprot:CAMPEP_0202859812 /NCGR_PEP_ID=MMETSP1391-20130828/1776_1 /ASSEMBLY_ACC=CAM_ASM_000867 /TAXON_ID=1034604 /ORGANISM="Chlamydomonas leiostraca, Strain SAG 11-49" /LENGTH=286 /DNA_ID=CAMNT_0049538899 /DNA_START=34 /DNA_END=894 /DNA_ORIENTATION=+
MERVLERAFTKVQASVSKVQSDYIAQQEKKSAPKGADATPAAEGEATGPETAKDAIKRILEAWKNKEYFKLIHLPDPTADELGRPVWPCTAGDVSRAYRKLSVLVHPDKNPGDEARAAFEALNEAHRMLKDAGRLEEVLKAAADKARRTKDAEEARIGAGAGRAALVSQKNAAVRQLRKEEGTAFQNEILAQMRKRKEEAERKAEAVARSRAAELQAAEQAHKKAAGGDSDDDHHRLGHKQHGKADQQGKRPAGRGGEGSDEEEDAGAARRAAAARAAKRKKPTFM